MTRIEGLSPSVRAGWTSAGTREETENGVTRIVEPALIPTRDQLLAYAGVLQLSERTFESHVRDVFGSGAAEMLNSMSTAARRVWTQYTFARPGINTDGQNPSDRNFSAHNALELLRDEGSHDLNSILTHEALSENRSVRIARQRALEASFVDPVVADD